MSDESKKRKLYFIEGKNPTEQERAKAAALGITAFRCARVAARSEEVESCAGAAGCVPAHLIKAGVKVLDKAESKPGK